MSFDWGNIAASAGLGMLHGINANKQEQKDNEEKTYQRSREAEADRQKLELHNQTVQSNSQSIESNTRALAEDQRKQGLNQKIGQYQQFKTANDLNAAAKLYIDTANQDNIGNPDMDPNHALSYAIGPDNTVTINLVDRNTGAVIKEARKGATIDDFIGATYQQIDPTKSYETQQSNAAATAKENAKNAFDLRKMGLQYQIDTQKDNNKFSNDAKLEEYRQGQNNARYQYGQDQATLRTVLGQEGQNWRTVNAPPTKNGKVAASGVQNILNFASSNPNIYAGMGSDQAISTMAMNAIESGGNINAVSPVGAKGVAQLMPATANYIQQRYGIDTSTPAGNVQGGSLYFNEQLQKFGDEKLAVAAYNWGPGHVENYVKYGSGMKKVNGQWVKGYHPDVPMPKETVDHIDRYFIAKDLIGQQLNAQQSNQLAGAINQNVQTAATDMAKTTGAGDSKAITSAVLGDLSGTQNIAAKFTNASSTAERRQLYSQLEAVVTNAIKNTPAGQAMTAAQIKGMRAQVIPKILGVGSLAEVGSFIREPEKQSTASNKKTTPSMSDRQLDDALNDIKPTKAGAKTGTIVNPWMNEGIKSAIKKEEPKFQVGMKYPG